MSYSLILSVLHCTLSFGFNLPFYFLFFLLFSWERERGREGERSATVAVYQPSLSQPLRRQCHPLSPSPFHLLLNLFFSYPLLLTKQNPSFIFLLLRLLLAIAVDLSTSVSTAFEIYQYNLKHLRNFP